MENRIQKVYSKTDRNISIDVIPGHFATNHSHVNYYVNMTDLKIKHNMAQAGATMLMEQFTLTPIDTILCLEGTEVVGAFLADRISQNQVSVNFRSNINILTPESNINNQMIFRNNTLQMVQGKNILLLLASVTTGKTIKRSIDCLEYYNGNLVGIGALFSAVSNVFNRDIHSIFTLMDIPQYRTFSTDQCEMCAAKQKMDAIINSFGYSKL